MPWNEIPLDNTPDQEFRITVPVEDGNIPLVLHLRFNTEGEYWHMDVSDGNTSEMLVSNVPLVTGEHPAANVMRQFKHLGIGSAMILNVTDNADGDIPDILNLGTDFILVWGGGEFD